MNDARTGFALVAALLAGVGGAHAQSIPLVDDWDVTGSNTVRLEHYDTDGAAAASPYAFDGDHIYDEVSLSLNRRSSPWDRWSAQVDGVFNASRYRSADSGFVPERLNLTHEKGDSALPYRWEVGDYFANFSLRTLQRSLKGATVELQPRTDGGPWRHSVVFVGGENVASWKDFQFEDDFLVGGSWVAEHRTLGSVGFNVVRNVRDDVASTGVLRRVHNVLSLTGRTERSLGGAPLLLEGEFAQFLGDHDGVAGAASGQGRKGAGIFFQATGETDSPFHYRFRFESYDQDFRPSGAVVTPDRRSAEAHVGYRFDNGIDFRARMQNFRDAKETANPVGTQTLGFSFSGPLLVPSGPLLRHDFSDVTGRLEVFSTDVEDATLTARNTTETVRLDLSKPLGSGINGRLGLFWQHFDNDLGAGLLTQQASIGIDAPIEFQGFTGTISPGLTWRNFHGGAAEGNEIAPSLAMNLAKGPHSVGFNYGYNRQLRDRAATVDLETRELAVNYQYSTRDDVFGIEFNNFDRNADPGTDTRAYRVSVFWTHHFEQPARVPPVERSKPLALAPAPVAGPRTSGPLLLAEFAPGTPLDAVHSRLAGAGVHGSANVASGVEVFEARLLAEVVQRQRLVLVAGAGVIERSALVVDLEDVGSPETAAQVFERMRRALIDRYGSPTRFFERGEFTAALTDDVAAGRFIRTMEWAFENATLRYGIPRRLDRRVRLEAQFARRFPAPQNTLWSIEVVR